VKERYNDFRSKRNIIFVTPYNIFSFRVQEASSKGNWNMILERSFFFTITKNRQNNYSRAGGYSTARNFYAVH
jgi:hypothetical protein